MVAAVISEAKQAALLSHTTIAHVLDLGLSGGTCFVATELAGGPTLDALLRRPWPISWSAAAYIVKEAAKALGYVHRRRDPGGALLRLVHGRLSPRRIVLCDNGGIKITGFGTSRAWTGRDLPRVPEAERGDPIDGRADVFMLGKILEVCLRRHEAPEALWRAVADATEPYQERRCTAWELEERLVAVLHRHHPCATAQELLGIHTPPRPQITGRLWQRAIPFRSRAGARRPR